MFRKLLLEAEKWPLMLRNDRLLRKICCGHMDMQPPIYGLTGFGKVSRQSFPSANCLHLGDIIRL
jgi:hypothetical protein